MKKNQRHPGMIKSGQHPPSMNAQISNPTYLALQNRKNTMISDMHQNPNLMTQELNKANQKLMTLPDMNPKTEK